MQSGKEKEQGVNYQSYRMNFALIGNIVPVGTRDEKYYTTFNTWTLIHIVPIPMQASHSLQGSDPH